MAGIASLFTREFFEAARGAARARRRALPVGAHLRHQHERSAVDRRHVHVGVSRRHALAGRRRRRPADRVRPRRSTQRLAASAHDLAAAGRRRRTSPASARSIRFTCSRCSSPKARGSRQWAAGAPIQTDDRADLEFSGPQSICRPHARRQRHPAARARRHGAAAGRRRGRGRRPQRQRRGATAGGCCIAPMRFVRRTTTSRAPSRPTRRRPRALDGLLAGQRRPRSGRRNARALLSRLASDPAHEAAKLALSRLLAAQGAYDEAVRIPLGLAAGQSGERGGARTDSPRSCRTSAIAERMMPVVSRLRAEAPASEAAHYYSAALAVHRRPHRPGAEGGAGRHRRKSRPRQGAEPRRAPVWPASGSATRRARPSGRRWRRIPRDPATYSNLATLELQAGNRELRRASISPRRSRSIRHPKPRRAGLALTSVAVRCLTVLCHPN